MAAVESFRVPAESTGLSVPLRIQSAVAVAAGKQPLSFGVCLPKAGLFEPRRAVLFDGEENAIQAQAKPLGFWGDGSVKWLHVDAPSPRLSCGVNPVRLHVSADASPEAGFPRRISVQEVGGLFLVDTGAAQFQVDRRRLRPFFKVELDGRLAIADCACRTICTDRKGRPHEACVERAYVESAGPVRSTLCLAGRFRRLGGLRLRARVSLFAGSRLVRMDLVLHNPKPARHKGGLWDLGDPGSVFFRDLSIEISPAPGFDGETVWRAETQAPVERTAGHALEIYQDSSGGENWQSPNHVNQEGRVPCRFRGYRIRCGDAEKRGLRASPTVLVKNRGGVVGGAVPEFWQQFPKAIEGAQGKLSIRLFPRQWDDLFELQGGEQKTHAVWFCFGQEEREVGESLAWVHEPARVYCPPEWYASSGAVPYLLPESADADPRLKSLAREALEGPNGLVRSREVIDEYGWRNFGDVWANHEEVHYRGPKPVISHYNNQFDVVFGAILQLMSSGDHRWFDVFAPLARHVIDVDIYHTGRDKANYNGGYFWHTDHYRSAHTATHRTYARCNAPRDGAPYGGGPSCEHNYATGLLCYHWMTGDPDARDAVLSLAQWVIHMDDGGRNALGLLDDGPTGWATCCGSLDYQGPGRGSANSLNVLLDAYLLSENQAYLDKARQIVHRCIHPADDLDRLELLDAERRWSYTMFLSALARYLDVKAERQALDEEYAYGQACLRHYAAWMAAHERPYLDRPEELQYPTETWAAQEFRKANALRAASRHVPEDLSAAFKRRAEELAERAWRDLLAFPSRTVARAIAIMMVEGVYDRFWRVSTAVPALRADVNPAILASPPPPFVPQRSRIRKQMTSLRGLLRTGLRLTWPPNWRPLVGTLRRYAAGEADGILPG